MGLPVEIAVRVMRFAGYEAKRRLEIPHDPFHPSNGEDLIKYLEFCWKLLIRCDLIAKALGEKIEWREEVSRCIVGFWHSEGCNNWHWVRPLRVGYRFSKPARYRV
jgi:hypothetical protein